MKRTSGGMKFEKGRPEPIRIEEWPDEPHPIRIVDSHSEEVLVALAPRSAEKVGRVLVNAAKRVRRKRAAERG